MNNKVWVFQSDKTFTESNLAIIKATIITYLKQWNAHGMALEGQFTIKYDQFIVIMVDEQMAQASGCSIDDMTRVIKQLEKELNLSLLDKMNIAFKGTANKIEILRLPEFKKAVKEGRIHSDTIIFNNAVTTLQEFNENWEVPIKDSWAKSLVK